MIKRKIRTPLLGIVFCILFLLVAWLPLTPFGNFYLQASSIFLVFIPMLCLPIGVLSLLGCLVEERRKSNMHIFFVCAAIFIGSLVGLRAGGSLRMHEFSRLAERSSALTECIYKFIEEEKRIPHSFEEMIPDYLSELPKTQMGAYPEYELIIPEDPSKYSDNKWILMVQCSLGVLNWDVFIYYPNQNYPEYDFGGFLESVGDWAYCHE